MIAIADQQRVATLGSGNTLDGASQTLPALYDLQADFNKPNDFPGVIPIVPPIGSYTAYNNTSSSGLSNFDNYNENTGLGTPMANLIVPALATLPPSPVSLSPSSLSAGTVGVPYTQTITASGGTRDKMVSYIVTSSTKPADLGLTFSEVSNELYITGTPSAAGTISFDVAAIDSVGVGISQSYTLVIKPSDVTSQISFSMSGLTYSRGTQLFGGSITLTNTGSTNLVGTLEIVLTGLPAGVTLANASDYTASGDPYILVDLSSGILPPGQSITLSLFFSNPNRLLFQYGIMALDENG